MFGCVWAEGIGRARVMYAGWARTMIFRPWVRGGWGRNWAGTSPVQAAGVLRHWHIGLGYITDPKVWRQLYLATWEHRQIRLRDIELDDVER